MTAARRMLYEQGVERSTLADIAVAADVPVGNVYYYFKTKDALVTAVIDSYLDGYGELSASLEQQDAPAARLKALLLALTSRRDQLARYGCPVGSLNSELGKRDDEVRAKAGRILGSLIGWVEAQFTAMGRDDARELAVALIAAYEGVTLIATTLRDPGLISAEADRLSHWIDSLERPASA